MGNRNADRRPDSRVLHTLEGWLSPRVSPRASSARTLCGSQSASLFDFRTDSK